MRNVCFLILSMVPASPLLLEDFLFPLYEQPALPRHRKSSLCLFCLEAILFCRPTAHPTVPRNCGNVFTSKFFYLGGFAGKRQLYLIPVIAHHFSLQSTAFSKLLQLCLWDPMAWHYSNMAFWMELQRRKNGLHHPASEAELELSSEVYGCKRGHTFCESSHEALNP